MDVLSKTPSTIHCDAKITRYIPRIPQLFASTPCKDKTDETIGSSMSEEFVRESGTSKKSTKMWTLDGTVCKATYSYPHHTKIHDIIVRSLSREESREEKQMQDEDQQHRPISSDNWRCPSTTSVTVQSLSRGEAGEDAEMHIEAEQDISSCQNRADDDDTLQRSGPTIKMDFGSNIAKSDQSMQLAVTEANATVTTSDPASVASSPRSDISEHPLKPRPRLFSMTSPMLEVSTGSSPRYPTLNADAISGLSGMAHPAADQVHAFNDNLMKYNNGVREGRHISKHIQLCNDSYVAIIGEIILKSPNKMVLLRDIYEEIQKNGIVYRTLPRSWKGIIRHRLSVNKCFVKYAEHLGSYRHFWAIHPHYYEAFKKGNYTTDRNERSVSFTSSCSEQDEVCASDVAFR